MRERVEENLILLETDVQQGYHKLRRRKGRLCRARERNVFPYFNFKFFLPTLSVLIGEMVVSRGAWLYNEMFIRGLFCDGFVQMYLENEFLSFLIAYKEIKACTFHNIHREKDCLNGTNLSRFRQIFGWHAVHFNMYWITSI